MTRCWTHSGAPFLHPPPLPPSCRAPASSPSVWRRTLPSLRLDSRRSRLLCFHLGHSHWASGCGQGAEGACWLTSGQGQQVGLLYQAPPLWSLHSHKGRHLAGGMWGRSGGKLQNRCAHVPLSHFCWKHEAAGGLSWAGGQNWSGGYAGAEDPCWPAGS